MEAATGALCSVALAALGGLIGKNANRIKGDEFEMVGCLGRSAGWFLGNSCIKYMDMMTWLLFFSFRDQHKLASLGDVVFRFLCDVFQVKICSYHDVYQLFCVKLPCHNQGWFGVFLFSWLVLTKWAKMQQKMNLVKL